MSEVDVSTVVITGASRGIGLELCRRCAARGDRVIATCRTPSSADALQAVAVSQSTVSVVELDVASTDSVQAAFREISKQASKIDVLINNAGQNNRSSFEDFDADSFLAVLDVNAVGPLRVTRAALELLDKSDGPRVGFVSSQLGSLSIQAAGFGSLDYNVSKAALNMVSRKLSFELAERRILTAAIHPGWVKTDMGGQSAPLSASESATGILAVLDELNEAGSGGFYRFDGTVHPW